MQSVCTSDDPTPPCSNSRLELVFLRCLYLRLAGLSRVVLGGFKGAPLGGLQSAVHDDLWGCVVPASIVIRDGASTIDFLPAIASCAR